MYNSFYEPLLSLNETFVHVRTTYARLYDRKAGETVWMIGTVMQVRVSAMAASAVAIEDACNALSSSQCSNEADTSTSDGRLALHAR